MAEKEPTERRVYVLPAELVERIRRYQKDHLIASEVEAVRRLLDTALHLRDNVHSLLQKMLDKFQVEKDIRIIARDVLAVHPLVESILNSSSSVEFSLKDGSKGYLRNDGKAFFHRNGSWVEEDYMPF